MDQLALGKLVGKLRKLPCETEWVEFKESNADPKKIGQYISALANSALLHEEPYGFLLFGVKDENHQVVGTTFSLKKKKRGNEPLEQWLNSMVKPKIDLRIFEFEIENKKLVLIRIGAALGRPVTFQHLGYIRIGSTTHKLSDYPNLEAKIWNMGKGLSFEKEIAVGSVSPQSISTWIDVGAYFRLMEKQIPEGQNAKFSQLVSEKLLVRNGENYDITNLGAILFARNFSEIEHLERRAVRVIVYEGKGRIQTKKEQLGHFGYAVKFNGLIDWIYEESPANEVIEDAYREENKMFPKVAIRELVANALIHQDFNETGTSVMVEIFEDRIEITNPGRPLIDTWRFVDEPPRSRNEILASFMRRAGICEERGSGIDRVVSKCEELMLPAPDFKAYESHLKATLFSYKNLNDMDKEDRVRSCYLHCCLKYVQNEQLSNESLRERFGIHKRNHATASRIIKETLDFGRIKLKDPDSKSKKYAKYVPFWA